MTLKTVVATHVVFYFELTKSPVSFTDCITCMYRADTHEEECSIARPLDMQPDRVVYLDVQPIDQPLQPVHLLVTQRA